VFHSTIGAERGDFTIDDVAEAVTKKLVLRHPHVFGEKELATATDVLDNWDQLKADERLASGKVQKDHASILDEVPVHFPALLEGLKLTKKAAKTGFDWENAGQIFEKLDEEVAELKDALVNGDADHAGEEIGDLLFVVMNLARHLDVEPETALKRTNRKFRERFRYIEDKLKESGRSLEDADLKEMDDLWDLAKQARQHTSGS
jgi:MazG family protein